MQTEKQHEQKQVVNKRYAPRWKTHVNGVCRCEPDDTFCQVQIDNLSCAGACFSADKLFAINQNVNLTIFLPDKGAVRASGTVMWSEIVNFQKKVGIRFYNTSSEVQESILQHVMNTDNTSLKDYWFQGWEGK